MKALVLLASASSVVPVDLNTSVCSVDGPRALLATVHELVGDRQPASPSFAS
jgi:hypothetical protein